MSGKQNTHKREREIEIETCNCKQNTGIIQIADTDMTDSSHEQIIGEYSDDQTFNNKLFSGKVGIQQTLNNLLTKFENQHEEIHGIDNDIRQKWHLRHTSSCCYRN